jgi:hypothetical protein
MAKKTKITTPVTPCGDKKLARILHQLVEFHLDGRYNIEAP